MQKKTKLFLGGAMMALMLFLSGCARKATTTGHLKPPTGFFYGSIYKYFGIPIQHLMNWLAGLLGGSGNAYGWAIIIITFVVRLILLPLMLNQSKKMTEQQEKMRVLQPQLNLIQEQQKKATTTEEKSQLSSLMMQVYQKNGTSMMPSLGCLTLIIQLPIFSGLYMAIEYSAKISASHFFGFNLGKSSLTITIVATLFYLAQGYLSMYHMAPEQKKQMQTTLLMSPLITFFISLFAPAGLALYFLVGGIIIVIQQAITTFIITPQIKRRIDANLKEHPVVEVVTPETFAHPDVTPNSTADNGSAGTAKESQAEISHEENRKRNAGKQQHHPHA
ncbi:membrane protein insertase YidC [Lactobacillus selangorensis]|nr:membrane protein insertase YidC [Lactobacillus selangorensis]